MSKLLHPVTWKKQKILELIKKSYYKFDFYGIRIWFGIYIGILDGRRKD